MSLTAFALNCSLKPSHANEKSSTDKILSDLIAALKPYDVISGGPVRVADHNVKPGVLSDEGNGDDWPKLRAQILAADILLLGLPIWMGQPSSVAKRVLERMDAFLSETDDLGRMPAAGKVAIVAIVGNEDGAHACHAACFQSLNDVGFTIPANCGVYWVGEAMGNIDYVDLPSAPKKVAGMIEMAVSNAVHLAKLLKGENYVGVPQ
ncbi:NADPH-dependent oxidoreductase (plasmid) [Mesorhizobium sp. NBSH29]|uniref:flavodoxin family protein n=1 Tax=Mesorhizobium sp. NBSH29 TaxID=2654249 RepID=UPI001896A137|nr:NAD(P)H-dependent oxidoreductase [Mesorhizobium sp. NBSH29]QPC88897.1 NADPH-dependent oxidoreductase [Mesorhizobium sp. NBSH29]QPC89045.1 NADPH-dependent oxidoreductase [Mesorhizobium sp. NBSH29]